MSLYPVSDRRMADVLAQITAGPATIEGMVKTTGFSRSGVWNAVQSLLDKKQIIIIGELDSHGGARRKLYALTGTAPALRVAPRLKAEMSASSAGAQHLIRLALRGHSLTTEQISIRIGMTLESVRKGLAALGDAVVSEGGRRNIRYRLVAKPERGDGTPRPFRIAGRIEHGRGSRWGAGLV